MVRMEVAESHCMNWKISCKANEQGAVLINAHHLSNIELNMYSIAFERPEPWLNVLFALVEQHGYDNKLKLLPDNEMLFQGTQCP
jgi:hypothetical protein